MSALIFTAARVRFASRGAELWALDGIDAVLEAGKVTAIVGPNGAGKTTLLKAAAELLPLTSGSCTLFDRAVSEWPRDTLARRVAYLPQGSEAAWPLPSRLIVALGRMPHGGGLTHIKPGDVEAIGRAMARTGVEEFAERPINKLSSGERARVLLARALATEADVLLADEPAAHLDPAHQLRLMEILREEAARGVAVIVTLHELGLAARCDRVLVLKRGRVAAEGPPESALDDGILARVFGIAALRAQADGASALVPWRIVG